MFFKKLCFGAFLVMMSLTSRKVAGTGQGVGMLPFMGGSGSAQATAPADTEAYGENEPVERRSYEELAKELRSVGLVVPEELVGELAEDEVDEMYEEYLRNVYETDPAYGYREILMYLGYGTYDEDFNWSPMSDQVYAFDCEMWDLSNMYTEVLNGIISISGGEYEITDIEESTDLVDYDNNDGVQLLSFKYNGVPYTFEAEVNYDWLDLGFLDFMNQVFKEQGNPKRLLITSDGGQGCILLYNTPEWGRQLDALTGLEIYDSLD